MQKIHCKSEKCIHNQDAECAAETILVKGGFADKSQNTYCDSYSEDAGAYILHQAESRIARGEKGSVGPWLDTEFGDDTGPDGTEVNCTASKCAFNDNYRCSADKITINDPRRNPKGRSDCVSFRPQR